MTIKTKLHVSILASLIAAVIIIPAILIVSNRNQEDYRRIQQYNSILPKVFALSNLTGSYLFHPNERTREQWETVHASLGSLLDEIHPESPLENSILALLEKSAQELVSPFSRLVSMQGAGEANPFSNNLKEMLSNHISVQLQVMLGDASRLMQESRRRMLESEKRVDRITVVLLLLLAVTSGGSLLFTSNRILKSIVALQEAVGRVAEKRWEKKVAVTGEDEIGRLAQAFNRMALDLSRSYGDLEREIEERKRAEEDLKLYRDRLQQLVEERTAELTNANLQLKQEITVRKEAEATLQEAKEDLDRRVRERTEQLDQKNRELQEFVYIASHDLQAPLRKIQVFSSLVKEAYQNSHGDGVKDYLNRIAKNAERMQQFIQALLQYSRTGTKIESFTPVNLNKIVGRAVSNLEVIRSERGGKIDVGNLPTIEADPVRMVQLFQNIIENALKFYREDHPPVVKIQAEILEDRERAPLCRIFVEDNGIGFEEKDVDRIFSPFERLHGRDDYDGTGIGLATCRKIVQLHGGTITAKSSPGEGSTFIIDLPSKQS